MTSKRKAPIKPRRKLTQNLFHKGRAIMKIQLWRDDRNSQITNRKRANRVTKKVDELLTNSIGHSWNENVALRMISTKTQKQKELIKGWFENKSWMIGTMAKHNLVICKGEVGKLYFVTPPMIFEVRSVRIMLNSKSVILYLTICFILIKWFLV